MTYFNFVRLQKGGQFSNKIEGFESIYVIMSGNCNIEVNKQCFNDIGQRADIWSGEADSVYASSNASVTVTANCDGTKIAVAGGKCDREYSPFRVTPAEVEMVDVGSNATHSHRRIFHILGQNAEGRTGNLLISELLADGGCWNGYPPHKHDEDIGSLESGFEETGFEELYYYQFKPETGFGAQIVYQKDGSSLAYMTRHGDVMLIDKGYHPTVTSPGHKEYIFTVLVGHTQHSLIQNFEEKHRYLMDTIPGINSMRDAFK